MKKAIGWLLIGMMLLGWTGCAEQTGTADDGERLRASVSSFESGVRISYRDITARATVNRDVMGTLQLYFEQPQEIEGLTVTLSQDDVQMQYRGISFSLDPDSLPGSMAAKLMEKAIAAVLSENEITMEKDGDILTVTGHTEDGAFTLRLDLKNLTLLDLAIPAQELRLEFTNFHVLS